MHLPMALIFGLLTALVSLTILIRLYFKKYLNNQQFVFHFFGSLFCAVLVFFMGQWAYLSFYLRWVFAVLYLVVFILTVIKRSKMNKGKPGLGSGVYIIFRLIFTLMMGFLVFTYFSSRNLDRPAIALKFPFRSGTYYIMQGGTNRLTNPAHRNFSMSKYGFAEDISKLYATGNRAKGILPESVKDYAIYGDTVLSPCRGRVILVCDTVQTNKPGHYNIKNVHGNHIIIQCKGYRVFLAHFIKDNIFVKPGDIVNAGTPLGIAGNSGFSAEPHLHINVYTDYDTEQYVEDANRKENHKKRMRDAIYDDFRYSGTSTPFTLDGNFYILNDIIEK